MRFAQAIRAAITLAILGATCVYSQCYSCPQPVRHYGFVGGYSAYSAGYRPAFAPQMVQVNHQMLQVGYRTPWQPPRYPMTPSGPYLVPRGPFPGPYMPSPYSYQPIGQIGPASSGALPGSVTNSPSKCPGGICPMR